MADHQFEDATLAALYDTFCAWERRDDLEFYLPLAMAADAVLDVGCGTGMLLRRARDLGHGGRLTGLDPAAGMLAQARRCDGVQWIHGDLSTVRFLSEFDVVVMTGHAFQVLLTDDEIDGNLAAIARALRPGGRFAFETRNPSVRAWEGWTPDHAEEIDGVRMAHHVETVDGELVTFTTTYTNHGWDAPAVSRSTLRFLGRDALADRLAAAGFFITEQYGDWDRSPYTPGSREIITIGSVA